MQVRVLKAFSRSGVTRSQCHLSNQLIKTGSASDATSELLCSSACYHMVCWSFDQFPPHSALLTSIWPHLSLVVPGVWQCWLSIKQEPSLLDQDCKVQEGRVKLPSFCCFYFGSVQLRRSCWMYNRSQRNPDKFLCSKRRLYFAYYLCIQWDEHFFLMVLF